MTRPDPDAPHPRDIALEQATPELTTLLDAESEPEDGPSDLTAS